MYPQSLQHTLRIFGLLYDEIPPLVPGDIMADMAAALDQAEHNLHLTMVELEDSMISFGKKIWPYRKAFGEILDIYEGSVGEKFFLHRLTPSMKKKYEEFKEYGGTFRDLHSGAPASYFESEERGELCTALVDMHNDVLTLAKQKVLSTERDQYKKSIEEFKKILEDVEFKMRGLLTMADNEQEHPELATEIRAQVRSFEYGLCLLGPPHSYEAVCNAEVHFIGRKAEKNMSL